MPVTLARILLRNWRLAAGVTQTAMAKELGIKQPAYCDWENGKRIPELHRRPSIERVTDGAVPADAWPKPKRRKKPHRVLRSKAGPLPAESVRSSRTSLSR